MSQQPPTTAQDMQNRVHNFRVDFANLMNNGMKDGVPITFIVGLLAETEFEMRLAVLDQRDALREQALAKAIIPSSVMPKGPANG